MRLPTRSRPYVCLPCQLKTYRLPATSRVFKPINGKFSTSTSRANLIINSPGIFEKKLETEYTSISSQQNDGDKSTKKRADNGQNETTETATVRQYPPVRRKRGHTTVAQKIHPSSDSPSSIRSRRFATATSATIELSDAQRQELKDVQNLRQRLHRGLKNVPEIKKDASVMDGIMIEDILKALPSEGRSPQEQRIISQLGREFGGQTFGDFKNDLNLIKTHQNPVRKAVTNPKAKDILLRLGIVNGDHAETEKSVSPDGAASLSEASHTHPRVSPSTDVTSSRPGRQRQSLARMVASQPTLSKNPTAKAAPSGAHLKPVPLKKTSLQTIEAKDLSMSSVETDQQATLPELSFDLSRVLFNPGVYQLQDPRSRVYNFDPYLEHLMPVSEFNFGALNPYMTSSEDGQLLSLARSHGKKYVGSSSSMTSVLSQFHFIISQWRELNTVNFTRGFDDVLQTFTHLSRAPSAIFLRYRDGVYAVDADKEFDEPSILMNLGLAMEKLLTLEKQDFEKWRKSNAAVDNQQPKSQPEAFHYSQQGQFLLRSQLDVHDPRLPGTGYFDLKTRAVVGIRNLREQEDGKGYQIKERFGEWESYEREYYDMMRSTFLKYSLQVRMGFMDGIFVAYHNISRLFGFQYIPLSEMDVALHGQSDPCLGDQEYRFSINFIEEIFNQATQTYPEQSLRIHFETREATVSEPQPYMHVYIQPMAEDDIQLIQASNKAQFESFERKMLQGEDPEPIVDVESELETSSEGHSSESINPVNDEKPAVSVLPEINAAPTPVGPASNAANKTFMNNLSNRKEAHVKPTIHNHKIMAFKLTLQNYINGRPVIRPASVGPSTKWSIDYQLQRLSDDHARKLYIHCHNRRTAALKAVTNRGANDYFSRSLRQLSVKGAEWRKRQDELDAQRGKVVLYEDRLPG